MKDKIKKIITIIFIVFAILFGFSWVKSCNNAKDIKTYENVAQMHQKAPKRANEEDFGPENKDYIIFDSNIIEKVEIGQEEYITENDKVIVDLWYQATDNEYDIKIYFKKGYAYQKTSNINDNFIFSTLNNEEQAFYVTEYKNSYNYNYSTLHIDYGNDNSDVAQVTTITLKEELIKHNFDYLTNKSLILNSSLSSQFGDNLFNADKYNYSGELAKTRCTFSISNQTITINSTTGGDTFIGGVAITGNSYGNVLGLKTYLEPNTRYYLTTNNYDINALYVTEFNSNNVSLGITYLNQSGSFTTKSDTSYITIRYGLTNAVASTSYTFNVMLNKGSYALPYHKYIDISQNNDRVRLLTKDNSLNDRIYATYFYSNSYKQLIPKEDLIPIIAIENNKLGFAIGTGTESTNQPIFDYNNRVYLNGYGFIPRTLVFTNQFNHDNLNCFVLNNYQEGYADYENEILFTEYLLNNSQPFTTDQIDTYNIGYQMGKSDGIYQALEWTNLIKELAKSLESFLNIQILPNITIKLLILVPLMFSILNFIIKLFLK